MISKRRKKIGGIEFTLLQKPVSPLPIDENQLYDDLETKLVDHLSEQIESLPTQISTATTTEIITIIQSQSDSILSSITLTTEMVLDSISNDPFEGSILTYDDQIDEMIWNQSPNVRLTQIDNTLSNYNFNFVSDHIQPNKLHLPFAVAWGENTWGGQGKSGIFWLDPWDEPVDNYSIKMGRDDEDLGETGYTFGGIGDLAMRFTNDTAKGVSGPTARGFVWTRYGVGGEVPIMALDTLAADDYLGVPQKPTNYPWSSNTLFLKGRISFADYVGEVDKLFYFDNIPENHDGYILTIDTASTFNGSAVATFKANAGAAGSGTLAGLSDTTIISPAVNEALIYDPDTLKWVNSSVTSTVLAHEHNASQISGGVLPSEVSYTNFSGIGLWNKGNIYLDWADTSAIDDRYLYFFQGTQDGAYLQYHKDTTVPTNRYFEISDDLRVLGPISGNSGITLHGDIVTTGDVQATGEGHFGGPLFISDWDNYGKIYFNPDSITAPSIYYNSGASPGAFYFNEAIEIDGIVRSRGNVYVNSIPIAVDSKLYFSGVTEWLIFSADTGYFELSNSLDVDGIIYSGGVDIATTLLSTGGTIKASQVDGNTIQADSTFAGGSSDHYWFPASLLLYGNEFYLDSAGAFAQSELKFHSSDAWCIYHHATSEFRWGPDTINTALFGEVCVGGNSLYLSNFAAAGVIGADNVIGSGIWFGSGSSSEHLTYETGTVISASTSFVANGSIKAGTYVRATTSLFADDFVYINYDGDVGDSYVYFHDGASTTGAHLNFNNVDDEFYLSHSLTIDGTLTATTINSETILSGGVDISTLFIGGSVSVESSDGYIKNFITSADTEEARGGILQDAKDYASAGDIIRVGPGSYDTNDILKTDVNYYFEPGAIIDYSGTDNNAIFLTHDVSTTNTIGGYGVFINRGNSSIISQVFNFTADTFYDVSIKCESINSVADVAIRLGGSSDNSNVKVSAKEILSYDGTIDNVSTSGTIEIHSDYIYSDNGFVVEQDGGETIVHGAILSSATLNAVESIYGKVKLHDCLIYAAAGEVAINIDGGSNYPVELYSCGIDSDQSPQLYGDFIMSNCFNLDGSLVTTTGTINLLNTFAYSDLTSTGHTHAYSATTSTGHTHPASQVMDGTFEGNAYDFDSTSVYFGQDIYINFADESGKIYFMDEDSVYNGGSLYLTDIFYLSHSLTIDGSLTAITVSATTVVVKEEIEYPDGILVSHMILPQDMRSTYNWQGVPTQYVNQLYVYTQISAATQTGTTTFFLPNNFLSGTPVTVDLWWGAGVSPAGDADIRFDVNRRPFAQNNVQNFNGDAWNPAADYVDYGVNSYTSITLTSISGKGQTCMYFPNVKIVDDNGHINGDDVRKNDMIGINLSFTHSAVDGMTNNLYKFYGLRINYYKEKESQPQALP